MPKTNRKGLGALLCLINVAVPLSMDMYTPAVPAMAEHLSTTNAMVGHTLTLFFLACLIGMLVSGPLSDKYGRKPLLVMGTSLFLIGSIGCALSPSIYPLLASRMISALGAGAMISCAFAIVRDAYDNETREKMLSAMQVVMMVGPVVAPVVGAAALQLLSWRGIFGLISLFGAVVAAWSVIIPETLPADQRTDGGVLDSLKGLALVAKDGWFMKTLIARNAYCVAWLGYVASASFVLEDTFGFSPMQYSLAFAFIGLISAVAPILFAPVINKLGMRKPITIMLAINLVLAIAFAILGRVNWIPYVLVLGIYFAIGTAIQPSIANALLGSRTENIGSASGMLSAFPQGMGTLGMFLVTLPMLDYIGWMTVLSILTMVISLSFWISASRDKNGFIQ